MESITSGSLDIYEEFGVPENASSREITKRYRTLALKYHPDKNPTKEARDKFDLVSLIYSVLIDSQLRHHYDNVRKNLIRHIGVSEEALQQIRKFREELEKAEAAGKAQRKNPKNSSGDIQLEQLRLEGLEYRRHFQQKHASTPGYVSFRELISDGPFTHFLEADPCTKVTVRWKYKSEAQIDDGLLQEIMSRFGNVLSGCVDKCDDLYCQGTVVFESDEAASEAVHHDYRKSATLWDGTRVRKLASLLRECKLQLALSYENEYAESLIRQLAH